MSVVTVILVSLLVIVSVLAWILPSRDDAHLLTSGLQAAGLAALGLVAVLAGPITGGGLVADALLVDLFVVAVVGGGPATASVLRLVDRDGAGRMRGLHAEQVLRGGAWIGVFERTAVFSALAAGWPEGLAVVLALKGLGRYSELRADAGGSGSGQAAGLAGGVAERFIIGTFASVLWAVGCAGILTALTR
jgi:hypothetical protein